MDQIDEQLISCLTPEEFKRYTEALNNGILPFYVLPEEFKLFEMGKDGKYHVCDESVTYYLIITR